MSSKMASWRYITVSVPSDIFEILERIKKDKDYGIVSRIFQEAVRNFINQNLDLEAINDKLNLKKEEISKIQQEINQLSEQKKALEAKEESLKLSQEADSIEQEEEAEDDTHKERALNLLADVIEGKWRVTRTEALDLAKDYKSYCAFEVSNGRKPIPPVDFMQKIGKEVREKKNDTQE